MYLWSPWVKKNAAMNSTREWYSFVRFIDKSCVSELSMSNKMTRSCSKHLHHMRWLAVEPRLSHWKGRGTRQSTGCRQWWRSIWFWCTCNKQWYLKQCCFVSHLKNNASAFVRERVGDSTETLVSVLLGDQIPKQDLVRFFSGSIHVSSRAVMVRRHMDSCGLQDPPSTWGRRSSWRRSSRRFTKSCFKKYCGVIGPMVT